MYNDKLKMKTNCEFVIENNVGFENVSQELRGNIFLVSPTEKVLHLLQLLQLSSTEIHNANNKTMVSNVSFKIAIASDC